jgi:hypothetical protein
MEEPQRRQLKFLVPPFYIILPSIDGYKWLKVEHVCMSFAIKHEAHMNRAFLSQPRLHFPR